MKKFILLYIAPMSPDERMGGMSKEEMDKMMKPWMAWKEKVGSALVDFGNPMIKGMRYTKTENSKASSHVTGYSIVQAEDMEAVHIMLATHPYMNMPETSIEVYELMPM